MPFNGRYLFLDEQIYESRTMCDSKWHHRVLKRMCTKNSGGFLDLYMSPAKHSDDQTEAHICHNHGSALLVVATKV